MNGLSQEELARMEKEAQMIRQKSVTFTIRMDKSELVRAIAALDHGGYRAKNRSDVLKTICKLWLNENHTQDVKDNNIRFWNFATFGQDLYFNNYKKPSKE